jgi:hypothetical protein
VASVAPSSARSSATTIADEVLAARPAPRRRAAKATAGPVLTLEQRQWAKQPPGDLLSALWQMRIQDLKAFLAIMKITDPSIDSRSRAVTALYEHLISASSSSSDDETPGTGSTAGVGISPAVVAEVIMGPVVHAHLAIILFFWFIVCFTFGAHDHVPGPQFIQPGARFKTNFVTNPT